MRETQMGMINDLQLIVQTKLNSIKTEYGIVEISYRIAKRDQMYPHIVFDFTDISPTDMGRSDFTLDIHIWGKDQFACFNIMDAVRDLFSFWNAPETYEGQTILPTFYEMSGGSIDDPDKSLIHLVVRLQGQVYNSGGTNAGILGEEQVNGLNN